MQNIRRSSLHNLGMMSQKSVGNESESPNVKNDEENSNATDVKENKVISVSRVKDRYVISL